MKAKYVKEVDKKALKSSILLRNLPARQMFLVLMGTCESSRMIEIVTFGHLSGVSEDTVLVRKTEGVFNPDPELLASCERPKPIEIPMVNMYICSKSSQKEP